MTDSIIAGQSLGASGIAAAALGQPWDYSASVSEKVKALENEALVSYSYVYNMNIVHITFAGNQYR